MIPIDRFQFHKVRLKDTGSDEALGTIAFQFHKVRLKERETFRYYAVSE